MIIDLYKSILSYVGLDSDKDGVIFNKLDEKKEPLLIDGKTCVLPLESQLRNYSEDKLVFHPLAENILERSENAIVKKIKDAINIRLNYTSGVVAQSLLNILVSPELHKRLTSDQSYILDVASDIDAKTLDNFIHSMLTGMKKDASKLFTNLYIKRSGKYEKKQVSRLAVLSFPFYEGIDKLKVRKKDKVAYKALFEFIFPSIEESEHYNYGTSCRVAPTLDAVLMGSLALASRLNDLTELYSDFIDDAEMLMFDGEWVESFNDLEALMGEIRKIPAQLSPVVSEAPSTVPVNPPYPQQPTVPQLAQQPMQQGYPPQPQVQEVKKTANGLDFNDVVATTPQLAYNVNPLAPALQRQYMDRMQQQAPMQPGYPQQQMQPPMQPGYPQQQMQPPMQQGYPPQQMQPPMQQGYPPQQMQPGYPQQQMQQPVNNGATYRAPDGNQYQSFLY